MTLRMIGNWTAGAVALGLALPAIAQDGMLSFASDAALRTFLTTAPPPVEAPPPPPPPPPPPISHHDRPVPGLPSPPRPRGPVQHDPPRSYSPAERVATPGVDAGDLVQAVGDHLVVLRRGRLFSIATVGDRLETVDSIDAFAPGAAALRDWTDQMFAIGDDRVAVVAFSAARGGTEVSRFRVSPAGELGWIDTHQLDRGGPSASTAARVVDGRLIVYAQPSFGREGGGDPLDALPVVRRWSPQGAWEDERMVRADEVFVAAPLLALGGGRLEMASVTHCDLAAAELACDATVALVPWTRAFQVARDAVYVWTHTPGDEGPADPAYLYRIPHDGSDPASIRVWGEPVNASVFGLSRDGDRLHVLVQPSTRGDAAFSRDFADGRPAALRLPLDRLGDGSAVVRRSDYQFLPRESDDFTWQARAAGGDLLYAFKPDGAPDPQIKLVVAPGSGGASAQFDVKDGIYRIAPIGGDAVVVGAGAGLPLTVVDLDAPALGPTWAQPGTAEHESREYEFRYRPDPDAPDGGRGLLAFPAGSSFAALDMLFVRRDGDRLAEAGRLTSTRRTRADDGCRASCAAWYRDARAVFVDGRIFALLAYELVEGEMTPDGLREIRRLDFAPPEPPAE